MYTKIVVVALIVILCSALPAVAGHKIVDAYYKHDVPFPEFTEYWHDISDREAALGLKLWEKPLAGSVQIYIKNTGTAPLEIKDVLLAGISLKRAIVLSDQNIRKEVDPSSMYFSDLKEADRKKLIAVGDPIWWRVQPQIVAPGEICEVAVRFRKNPPSSSVKLVLPVKSGKSITVDVPMKLRPRIESISFSSGLDKVYAYCTTKAQPPSNIYINGNEVTDKCTIAYDSAVGIAPIIIDLESPLKRGSFCCLQVVYNGGSKTTEFIKVWSDEPAYGMWGAQTGEEGDTARAKAYFDDLALHNINCQMEHIGTDCINSFLKTQEGRDYIASVGIRRTINEFGKQGTTNPYFYFTVDEPESADFFVKGVPPERLMGSHTQDVIRKAQSLHKDDPLTLSAVNINRTFPPHCFYAYGHIADVFMTDPYYTAALGKVFERWPNRAKRYMDAKSIYAMSKVPWSACAPHPLNMVLLSCSGPRFRFPTPEEKRIEVYYSLAAGAKQISYWWFTPNPPAEKSGSGCGYDSPAAKALWNEIGLLGAEFRTVSSLIADGCPADLAVTSSKEVWVRTLISGTDTAIVFCVNDYYVNDRIGTAYVPTPRTEISVKLPEWLDAQNAFEVSYKGISDVQLDKSGSKVSMRLGSTALTRMIVITADQNLRAKLQARYDEKFAANVKKLVEQKKSVTHESQTEDNVGG